MFLNSFVNSIKEMPKSNVIFWVLLFSFSCFTIIAMGVLGNKVITYGLWLYITLYLLKKLSNKSFVLYIVLVFLVSAMYLPTAINYGELNLGSVISLHETNLAESKEFLQLLGVKNFVYLAIYFVLFFLIIRFNKFVQISSDRKKSHGLFWFLVIIPIIFNPTKHIIKNKEISIGALERVKYYPLRLVTKFIFYSDDYYTSKKKLQQSLDSKSTWNITDTQQSYKNYVIVVGESMRRDYMSAYGYPIDTTPFLSKVNGLIFNNFISASYNTNMSLQRMLFQNVANNDTNYANTVVTLANAADMNTYWLSNQGKHGSYDILASSIGIKADEVFFLKKGDYLSKNKSDLGLLSQVDAILDRPSNKNRLIVLHLMGSHSNFCSRLDSHYEIENINDFVNKDLSCYLSTYRQTDKFLEKLYTQLKQQNEPFSLVYFSDHGLAHKKKFAKEITLLHKPNFKQNYEVPLVVLSSDDTQRKYITEYRSGYDFMTAISEWLGIKEKSLQREISFFSDVKDKDSVKVFNGESVIDFSTLADDPAMLLTRKD